MPIKGLSSVRRFMRGGKLRLGQKAVARSGKEYPQKVDHFIFDPDDSRLKAPFEDLFGPEPKRIKIAFASEDVNEIFPQHYKCYGSSGLLCKGDGDTAGRWHDGEIVETACPGPEECDFARSRGSHGKPGCKAVASLQFFIPDLPVLQVFQIDTGSRNSIININSGLDMLRSARGRIAGYPVDLVLEPMETNNPEDGKKITIYVLQIVVPIGLSQIHQLKTYAEIHGALPAPPPPPSDGTPVDIIPASQWEGEDDPGDDDTGNDEAEAAPAPPRRAEEPVQTATRRKVPPTAPTLENNPDVAAAFEAAGFSPAKTKALLASAAANSWDAETLIRTINIKSGAEDRNQGTARRQTGPAPHRKDEHRPAPPSQRPAVVASGDDGDF